MCRFAPTHSKDLRVEDQVIYTGVMSEESEKSVRELIEERDALLRLKEAIAKRIANVSKEEQMELDALVQRSLNPQCTFDRKNKNNLYALALFPEQSGWYFKLRERLHRFVHHH